MAEKKETEISAKQLEKERKVLEDLVEQRDTLTKQVEELKRIEQLTTVTYDTEKEIRHLRRNKELKSGDKYIKDIAFALWILVIICLGGVTLYLTWTYKSEFSAIAKKADQYSDLRQQIDKQQGDMEKLLSIVSPRPAEPQPQDPPKSSGGTSTTPNTEGAKVNNSKDDLNSSQPSDPYSQALRSLAYLCIISVIAMVVTLLVPLLRLLRKQDDYY
jgi:hypothetical protein